MGILGSNPGIFILGLTIGAILTPTLKNGNFYVPPSVLKWFDCTVNSFIIPNKYEIIPNF
jgi:hypothetical protein